MNWLLNTVYVCLLIVASPWLVWRYWSAGKNRRGWTQKLLGMVQQRESNRPCVWFHAVSVGEVNLLAPVLNELKRDNADLEVVISTTTETGFDLACKKYPQHYAFFCPLDFSWAIRRTLNRIRPDLIVLAELEVWPNLIQTSRSMGVPVAVINGRLSENSYRGYRRIRWIIGRTFSRLAMVGAQNETYATRFRELGCPAENVLVTGNVKFDGVETDRENPRTKSMARIANLNVDSQVFVAGSTQLEEDLLAASVYQQLSSEFPKLRLILVPRHPERSGSLISQLEQMGIGAVRRSTVESIHPQGLVDAPGSEAIAPVIVVDVIGELGAWWGCADVTYVGGSMGSRGGQNMIEPAAFGLPVSFGPNTRNFQEIVDELLAHQAATVVDDLSSLKSFVREALTDPEKAAAQGKRAGNVVIRHLGASQRTASVLSDMIRATANDSANGVKGSARAA